MTQQHPITPSIELVKQWQRPWHSAKRQRFGCCSRAIEAARWGADQELEACCEYLTAAPHGSLGAEAIQEIACPPPQAAELEAAGTGGLGPEPMPETALPRETSILNVSSH
jgi:hypothetical protein